jgi:amino acid adenylation domain-containing protein
MTDQLSSFNLEDGLPGRFLAICDLYPLRAAITEAGVTTTYSELRRRMNGFAAAMLDRGVKPGDRIVIHDDSATTTIAIILATLYLGCIYVPISPVLGRSQIEAVIAGVRPRLVLTGDRTLFPESFLEDGWLPPRAVGGMLASPISECRASADSIASILYTSGSTGQRKGVAQSHRNLLFHVAALTERFSITPDDVHSLTAPFIFDASTTDLYCTLLNGARLIPLDAGRRGARETLETLRNEGVTLLHATPTLLRNLAAASRAACLDRLRLAIIGGEPLFFRDVETFRRALSTGCRYVNGYGLTETSGFVALFEVPSDSHADCPSDGAVPAGRPPSGVQLELRPILGSEKEVGEIMVVSRHIGVGWWSPDSAAVSAFPSDEINPLARRYATGDVGRWTKAGDLMLLGRADRQVKVRGYRVDLDEIEAAYRAFPEVTHAAAAVADDGNGLKVYVCCHGGVQPNAVALHDHLRRMLPAYLLPLRTYLLPTMPLTVTGKLDRKAMSDLEALARPIETGGSHPPTESALQTLLFLAAELLHRELVSPNDRFFEIGGNSLMMTQLHAEITRLLCIDVPLFRFYEFPTLGALAEHIEFSRRDSTSARLEAIRDRLARREAKGP